MKAQYVTDLKTGDAVEAAFAVRSAEVRLARTGEPYLALELGDRTGVIHGVLFGPGRAVEDASTGDVVKVRGVVTTFRGTRRVRVTSLEPVASYRRSDLIPSARRPRAELVAELGRVVDGLGDVGLRRLVRAVLADEASFEAFTTCPASQSRHHAWLGGLLEHSLAVAVACRHVAASYEVVDADLLTAAALLHDIGKIDELSYDTCISYTDAGRLLGHVVLGERRISDVGRRIGLDDAVALRLAHIMVSHHGELEWGSPKRPAMLEALILHHVDNLDAKVAGFIETVAGAAQADARWTDVANLFRRPLFVPRAAEDDRHFVPVEDDQHYLASTA